MTDDARILIPASRDEWRRWLDANHRDATAIWLVIGKKGYRKGSLTLAEAVEEALCFGWIDGKARRRDDKTFKLRFTPRRPNSVWSITNVRRVNRLIKAGRMREAGLARVADARKNGQWDAAIKCERTDVLPRALESALRRRKGAIAAYRGLSESRKKQLLHWVYVARRPDTRKKRIEAIVEEVSE
jgi:uncharacterized protein YdeI (YjbR/CyaY-like superfamily)